MTLQQSSGKRIQQALEFSGLADNLQSENPEPSQNAVTVLKRRYFKKLGADGTQENQNQMLHRVAHNLAQADRQYEPNPDLAELLVQETKDKFYNLMTSKAFLPNSPTLMNAGAELQQLSACFVLPVEDSMESIFNSVLNTALIHKSGGGTGFSFNRLRPEGDPVGSTGGVASGPVSFMNAFDAATESVKQGGTRRGANMAILNFNHPDIMQFIDAKLSGKYLQNFNISVGITEDFIQDAQNNRDYELLNPRTGQTQGTLNAADVFNRICQSAWQTGDPGIIFLDRVNADNPNPQLGEIESTNPCVTADTIVATSNGPKTVRNLTGVEFHALIDGQEHRSGPQGFFSTGHRKVIKLTFQNSRTLTLTPEHLVMRANPADKGGRWQPAGSIRPGDRVRVHNHSTLTSSVKPNNAIERTATTATALRPRTKVDRTISAHPTRKVTSVEEAGTADVYDVQIPGINAFDANGFYVHNCGEQALLPYESCNLGSVNLARMVTTDQDDQTVVDWAKLAKTTQQAVHLLDNVIDMNRYPLPQIDQMSKSTRRIGVGLMGWADLLVQLGIPYNSQAAIDLAEEIMQAIQAETYRASTKLADQRGTFPAWAESIYNQGPSPRKMRNSAPTTIAPTGTISIIADASSGIEPLFAISFVRNVMDQTRMVESNPYFEAIAKSEGFYSEELMQQIAETGSVRHSPQVPDWVKEIFPVSHEIEPEWHVRMQAAFQKHTDNSVSKTINFPSNATVEDVKKAYLLAHSTGCKGLTIYRDGSKDQQVLSTGNTPQPGQQIMQIPENQHRGLVARKRPKVISGITELIRTGHGNMYITINFDEENMPFEVFTNLGKAGGCDSAQLEAISRLTSMALRAGVDTEEIIHNLQGITCCPHWDDNQQIRSTPDAVAIALRRHSSQPQETQLQIASQPYALQQQIPRYSGQDRCPECSAPTIRQEGCIQCTSPYCAWNKCD